MSSVCDGIEQTYTHWDQKASNKHYVIHKAKHFDLIDASKTTAISGFS